MTTRLMNGGHEGRHFLPPHPGSLPTGEGGSYAAVRRAEHPGLVEALARSFPLPEGEGQGEGKRDVRWLDSVVYTTVQPVIASFACLAMIRTVLAAGFKSVSPVGAQVGGPYPLGLVAGRFPYVPGQCLVSKTRDGSESCRVAKNTNGLLTPFLT